MGVGLRACRRAICLACLTLKVITPAIGVDNRLLSFHALLAVAMLHAQDAGEASLVDVLEDVAVVDFAGGGFLASGLVAHLEIGDLVPGGVHVGNLVAFGDLLVVEVIEDLDAGAVDPFADEIGLGILLRKTRGWLAHQLSGSSTMTRPAGSQTSAQYFRFSMTLAVW